MSQPWLPAQPADPGGVGAGNDNVNLWNQDPPSIEGDFFWWNGSLVLAATVEGWWDGSAVQPVEVVGWWDGTAVQPLQPAL